jgi:hypothetical protein
MVGNDPVGSVDVLGLAPDSSQVGIKANIARGYYRVAVQSLAELGRRLCEHDSNLYPIANEARQFAELFYRARLDQEQSALEFLQDQSFLWPSESQNLSAGLDVPDY